ncbi:hypothetical protein [Paraburkholderia kirstenboschensis]|uniref:Transposase n=1 Tax=Paraburkholderia kirstenboschensis TaxID=1245436 RepID=A0ABZ0EAF0_9BURK|nr:hypothetical protein [Paraburkholderia kirstenboschensis]WOD14218.1 hypothetical protein RW095_01525 [Paraburkholderia kirstenboschensis]
MESETYRGYNVWGHAILQQEAILAPERFAASGTITRNNKLVEASGVLGLFNAEAEAEQAGLAWALAWIDSHG